MLGQSVTVTIDPPKPSAYSQVFLDIKGGDIQAVSVLSDRKDIGCRTVKLADGGWLAITQAPASGGYAVYVAVTTKTGLYHQRHVIVDGAPTPPAPPPTPLPDGVLGLAKISRDAAKFVNRPTDAKALANAQRSIASAIRAGGLTQPTAALNAWREANRAAVDVGYWLEWGKAVTKALAILQEAGKLPWPDTFADAFEEIATGLEQSNG